MVQNLVSGGCPPPSDPLLYTAIYYPGHGASPPPPPLAITPEKMTELCIYYNTAHTEQSQNINTSIPNVVIYFSYVAGHLGRYNLVMVEHFNMIKALLYCCFNHYTSATTATQL